MQIIVKHRSDRDGQQCDRLIVDGKEVEHVGPLCECPEDAIIGRDLISCRTIAGYMKQAWEAGKSGQELTVEVIPDDEDDEDDDED